MTERIRIEHVFDCSEQRFWNTFLDDNYNRSMFLESMMFPRWEVTRLVENEDKVTRTVEVEPYVGPLPTPVKKALGDRIYYREEGCLTRSKNSYSVKILPSSLANKIHISGRQFTEAIDENSCRRIFDATVEIKLFAVGTLIERLICTELRKSYDAGATFTREYLLTH